ncbi:hypothetical protein BDQ12DRAFT_729494 [Crucibulum laeve]|uniref:Uncharacterized protein n=1 Tax=Crucibulum laeve TaxID=68775 RepID=A0A5C3LEI6_9AGAR|nr:hypothetical protein BDQ12DRAFT_729494 [Crucibulum laeve]
MEVEIYTHTKVQMRPLSPANPLPPLSNFSISELVARLLDLEESTTHVQLLAREDGARHVHWIENLAEASWPNDALRDVNNGIQEGDCDALGRDKTHLEEEHGMKVVWEHDMYIVEDTGAGVVGASLGASETVKEKSEETSARLQDAYYNKCLFQTASMISKPSITLSTFITDPTPKQHTPKPFPSSALFSGPSLALPLNATLLSFIAPSLLSSRIPISNCGSMTSSARRRVSLTLDMG